MVERVVADRRIVALAAPAASGFARADNADPHADARGQLVSEGWRRAAAGNFRRWASSPRRMARA